MFFTLWGLSSLGWRRASLARSAGANCALQPQRFVGRMMNGGGEEEANAPLAEKWGNSLTVRVGGLQKTHFFSYLHRSYYGHVYIIYIYIYMKKHIYFHIDLDSQERK